MPIYGPQKAYIYGPVYGPKKAWMSPRRLIGLYGPQEAYMGPHMGPRRLAWAPEGLYGPIYGPNKALIKT